MRGTLIDTTSLIALAMNSEPRLSNFWWESENPSENQLSGIESVLLSDHIIIDYPSYQRNLKRFPELKKFESFAEFINVNNNDEDNCYMSCAEIIVPLMNRPGEFLVDIYRRHISFLDYCEITTKDSYAPSTYWGHLSGQLSKGENNLVSALEKMFGKYTPFSGAALTNLIRFLYYTSCQEIFDCNWT